ncbi:MAG: serine hydrolase domain-containing protein, partial [Bacteroidota bacterium]
MLYPQLSSFITLLSLIFSLTAQGVHAQSTTDSLRIAEIVAQEVATNDFSGTVLVATAGKPIYHQSFGYAYRQSEVLVNNNTHYSVASITKTFTAIRILQLQEAGQLNVQDLVQPYLPQLKLPHSDQLSIHHLLLHISGLPNERDRDYHQPYTPLAFAQRVLGYKSPVSFGTFNYNNLDYVLLGMIIEKVTGSTWQDNIREHILAPLDMTATGFLKYGYYPKNFAYTYSYGKRKKPQQDPLFYIENFSAAGSMYSTTVDLLKLDQALYQNTLLCESGYAQLAQNHPGYDYVGYSVWNYRYPFVASKPLIMERRGGIMGANSVILRLPESQSTIIILSNTDRFNP